MAQTPYTVLGAIMRELAPAEIYERFTSETGGFSGKIHSSREEQNRASLVGTEQTGELPAVPARRLVNSPSLHRAWQPGSRYGKKKEEGFPSRDFKCVHTCIHTRARAGSVCVVRG